jgi:hypothetical protein
MIQVVGISYCHFQVSQNSKDISMKLSEPLLIEKQSMPALSENLTKIYLMLGWYRWVDFSVHSHHISHGPPER